MATVDPIDDFLDGPQKSKSDPVDDFLDSPATSETWKQQTSRYSALMDEPEPDISRALSKPEVSPLSEAILSKGKELSGDINEYLGYNKPDTNIVQNLGKGIVDLGVGLPAQAAATVTNLPNELSWAIDKPKDALETFLRSTKENIEMPFKPATYSWENIQKRPLDVGMNLAALFGAGKGMAGISDEMVAATAKEIATAEGISLDAAMQRAEAILSEEAIKRSVQDAQVKGMEQMLLPEGEAPIAPTEPVAQGMISPTAYGMKRSAPDLEVTLGENPRAALMDQPQNLADVDSDFFILKGEDDLSGLVGEGQNEVIRRRPGEPDKTILTDKSPNDTLENWRMRAGGPQSLDTGEAVSGVNLAPPEGDIGHVISPGDYPNVIRVEPKQEIAGLLEAPKEGAPKGPASLEDLQAEYGNQKLAYDDAVAKRQAIIDQNDRIRAKIEVEKAKPIETRKATIDAMIDKVEKSEGVSFGDRTAFYSLPEDTLKDIMNQYGKVVSSQGDDILTGLKEFRGVLTDNLGSKGGELGRRTSNGYHYRTQLITKFKDLTDNAKVILDKKFKDENSFKSAEERIFDALEDRANANKILQSDAEREAFPFVQKAYDMYGKERRAKGLTTLEDYANRVNDQLTHTEDRLQNFEQNIPKKIQAQASKERTGRLTNYQKGLWSDNLLNRYNHSMSKELAYSDALDYYHEAGLNKIGNMRKQKLVNDYMRDLLDPNPTSKDMDLINRIAKGTYEGRIKNNLWSYMQNLPQKHLAAMRISGEAAALRGKLSRMFTTSKLKKNIPEGLDNYFEDIHEDYSHMASDYEDVNMKPSKGGLFPGSEAGNWAASRVMGRIEYITKTPEYKNYLKQAKNNVEALDLTVQNHPDIAKAAKDYGENLAQQSQIEMGQASEPRMFRTSRKEPLFRAGAMLKRFNFGALEAAVDAFTERGQLKSILRQGLSKEASIADNYKAIQNLEKAVTEYSKRNPEAKPTLNIIRKDKMALKAEINKLQPQYRARAVTELGKYVTKGSAVRLLKYYMFGKSAAPAVSQLIDFPGLQNVQKPSDILSIVAAPRNMKAGSIVGAGLPFIPGIGAPLSTLNVITGNGINRGIDWLLDGGK